MVLGPCASYEYECNSGRCIDDDLSCTQYKSCGDDDNCRLSSGAIAGIVIGCLAGVGIIVIVLVMVCCCRRKRLPTTTVCVVIKLTHFLTDELSIYFSKFL